MKILHPLVCGTFVWGLFAGISAIAANRPTSLQCVTHKGRQLEFTISKFNTVRPNSNIEGGLLDLEVSTNLTQVCFSNECDNSYCFVFFNDDLDRAAQSENDVITGLLSYADASIEKGAQKTVPVECQKGDENASK